MKSVWQNLRDRPKTLAESTEKEFHENHWGICSVQNYWIAGED